MTFVCNTCGGPGFLPRRRTTGGWSCEACALAASAEADRERQLAENAKQAAMEALKARRAEDAAAWAAGAAARHRRYRREHFRERHRSDPMFNLKVRARSRIYLALRRDGYGKTTKTNDTLGCDWPTLKAHLESLFLPGMTWENRSEWHIDHRTPLASATTEAELLALCHYTNLQPLWALDNQKKGAKLDHGLRCETPAQYQCAIV